MIPFTSIFGQLQPSARRAVGNFLENGLSSRYFYRTNSYYVPVAVRRRQRLEALKSLREALHAETVMHTPDQETSAQRGDAESSTAPSVSALGNPTLDMAKNLPCSFRHLDNTSLMILASIDNPPLHKARSEYLKRHVMSVDNVDYVQATKRVEEIEQASRTHMSLTSIPYKVGIAFALTSSAVSFPLIFDVDTVTWFNETFVTTDTPEPKDLETWLEVGGWSWNWMEPVIGQVSFVLLCAQFARAQMHNLGLKPYTEKVAAMRAKRICELFPMYDRGILTSYSYSISYY